MGEVYTCLYERKCKNVCVSKLEVKRVNVLIWTADQKKCVNKWRFSTENIKNRKGKAVGMVYTYLYVSTVHICVCGCTCMSG